MKSPEYYGAAGDGVADDTLAWQSAIDSGETVKAESSKYKCGKLTITSDTIIDCNNAEFIVTDAILFDCYGEIIKETVESDYIANQKNYTLSDTFTGIAFIEGTNHVFKQRSYYKGGSVERFVNGVLTSSIPVDITSPTVHELDTICVNIKNISNVKFEDIENAVIVKLQYNENSVVENVNTDNVCYSVLALWQCYNCTYKDSTFSIAQYKTYATNYYPIGIYDSCYTKITNINGYCEGWHCISTGNHTLCRQTKVDNCVLVSDYPIPAYGDHPNGIETLIKNSDLTSVGVGVKSKIVNCIIRANVGDSMCRVNLDCCSVDGLAEYEIVDCDFYPEDQSFAGIRVYCSPQSSGYDYDYYFNSLKVVNCKNKSITIQMPIINGVASAITGTTRIDTISVKESTMQIACPAKTSTEMFSEY